MILPAQKELRQKTDIYFEFEEIKEVRSVVAIKFYIYPKKERKIPLSDKGSILLNKIKDDICLSNIKALDIIKKHDDFKIKLALNFTKQKAKENKSGYFIKILSDPDFGKKEFGLEKKKQDRIKKEQADEAQRLAESDRIEAEQKKADQWIQQNLKEIEQIKVKIGEKQKQKAWFRELSPEAQARNMKRQARFEVIDRLKKSGAGLSKQVQTLQE